MELSQINYLKVFPPRNSSNIIFHMKSSLEEKGEETLEKKCQLMRLEDNFTTSLQDDDKNLLHKFAWLKSSENLKVLRTM